jgi:hypothetical protein
VVPNFGPAASSSLTGGGWAVPNVAIQSVCPNDLTEHLGVGIYDNTAYRLALDALTRPGRADPARVAPTACLDPPMPGIDPGTRTAHYAATLASVAATVATAPRTTSEPALACCVTATCAAGRTAPQQRSTRVASTRSAAPSNRTRRRRRRARTRPRPAPVAFADAPARG